MGDAMAVSPQEGKRSEISRRGVSITRGEVTVQNPRDVVDGKVVRVIETKRVDGEKGGYVELERGEV